MKTIFDEVTRNELIDRIKKMDENSTAQWGKMNIYQMLKHCAKSDEMYLGKKQYKQAFIGKIFGQMALKNVLKDEKPLGRSTPTLPELKNLESSGDIEADKTRWITIVEEYGNFSIPGIVHPFFGKMTKEQLGYMVYKHTDHHLRQFNG